MGDADEGHQLRSQHGAGVLSECGGCSDLEHLRVGVSSACLEHEGGGAGRSTDGQPDSQVGDGVDQVVTVRIVAQHAGPGGTGPQSGEADGNVEVCATRESCEAGGEPQIVLDGAVSDQRLPEGEHGRRHRV